MSAAAVVAERIAEGLGWEETANQEGDCIVFGAGPLHSKQGEIWAVLPNTVEIDAPSETVFQFSLIIECGDCVRARPYYNKTYLSAKLRQTEQARQFILQVDNMTDGMITTGLLAANETACLEWLAGKGEG